MLWTFDPGSFLGAQDGPLQHILITARCPRGHEAAISFCTAEPDEIQTVIGLILFDGQDADAVAHARTQWSLTAAYIGAVLSDADGGWTMKASTEDVG